MPDWFGGLLNEQKDASGLMYRRNRCYDPQTGRFTQEDPIGIAGGLNVYGYAAGDPVFTVVETRLPGQAIQQMHHHVGRLDNIGPAIYAEVEQLTNATVGRILSVAP
ncbi:MAG TPA: RHS repeat-associated core domain-containing protein [Longimicrobium sp.]